MHTSTSSGRKTANVSKVRSGVASGYATWVSLAQATKRKIPGIIIF
jgi:hypothetical protein